MYIYTPDKMLIDCSSGDFYSSESDSGDVIVKCGEKLIVIVESIDLANNIISQIAQALSYGIRIVRIGDETGEMRVFYPENVAKNLPVDDVLSKLAKEKMTNKKDDS